MQLAPMRFVKIDGTAVSVTVTSAEEAKAALKELRHKKRELKFLQVLDEVRKLAAVQTPTTLDRGRFLRLSGTYVAR